MTATDYPTGKSLHLITPTIDPTFARRTAPSVQNPMRAKTNFSNEFMLICPVQSPAQKYFGFSETRIASI
jgi:hypothetical protein